MGNKMNVVSLMQWGAVALLNASYAWLVGALLARFWLRRIEIGPGSDPRSALRRSERWALLLCMTGMCGAAWSAAAVMGGMPLSEAGGTLALMLARSAYGHASVAGVALLLAIGALSLASARRQAIPWCAAALLLAFAWLRAVVSHAGESGMLGLELWIEWIHLLMIALWVGGVAVAGWVVLPIARADPRHGTVLRPYLTSLSDAATIALVAIFASGIYNAWQRLGAPSALFGNPYGSALIVKLSLVALAVALGGYNKLVGFPAVGRSDEASARAMNVLRIESLVLLGALAAAAVLTSLQPPSSL
jgi:putative copper resistance protein D